MRKVKRELDSAKLNRVWIHTRKSLLNIYHFPRAGLHEATLAASCPLEALLARDLSCALQIALVTRDNLDWWHAAVVKASLGLDVNHLHKIVKRIKRGAVGDVVDE